MGLAKKDVEEIRSWMYRNARDLELRLWQFYFEGGAAEAVVKAMLPYQNEDGGFGHAMEPDNWNPGSSPYTTLYAIHLLQQINFREIKHPIYQGILKYIESEVDFVDDYWRFNIPGNNEYPHAPWMNFSEEDNLVESNGITAGIVEFILETCDESSDNYKKALRLARGLINRLMGGEKHGDMGIRGYIDLVEKMQKLGIEGFDYDRIQDKLDHLVCESIEYNTEQWKYYGVLPSNYITTPHCRYYEKNKEILQKELEYIIRTKPQKGVWDITWTWFENNEQYAKEFAISENWWKAIKAIEKLILLAAFGEVDFN